VTGADFDMVVRGGMIVDGSGGQPFRADVAVLNGRIAAVGKITARGREEIDAGGLIVTPGFVDIHTHYDGHATWSQRMGPSSAQGVTTVVTGNCGVGFAPCRPEDRGSLVRLMEGVEDIPEAVMSAGLPWSWQSFPDFLDRLEERSFDMDVATQLPHAPLRVFVMGQRAVDREPARPEDIRSMADIARQAIRAGALGFSTSRTINHRASDGSYTPSLSAGEDELAGIAAALGSVDLGVLQMISDFDEPEAEFDMVERLVRNSGRPLSLSLMQVPKAPKRWEYLLGRIEKASNAGLPIKGQVCGRPIGVIMGLELKYHPFWLCPSYLSVADLALPERLVALRNPHLRSRLIAEYSMMEESPNLRSLDRAFLMDEVPDYEPKLIDSIAARAERAGKVPAEFAYDLLVEGDGRNVFYVPAMNYVDGTIDAVETMLRHKDTILGLGDGGAHCRIICDASMTTYMLTRWVKGREDPARALPAVIRALTATTAAAVGLEDRGMLTCGYKADLNLIDLDALKLHRPEIVYDLPAGGGRLHQRTGGIAATIVSGTVTYRAGEATGELPGRLVRGKQAALRR
jgi:N-acyl-D-aspartate/D-glutamate deacylase